MRRSGLLPLNGLGVRFPPALRCRSSTGRTVNSTLASVTCTVRSTDLLTTRYGLDAKSSGYFLLLMEGWVRFPTRTGWSPFLTRLVHEPHTTQYGSDAMRGDTSAGSIHSEKTSGGWYTEPHNSIRARCDGTGVTSLSKKMAPHSRTGSRAHLFVTGVGRSRRAARPFALLRT